MQGRLKLLAVAVIATAFVHPGIAGAQTCSQADFGRAVDSAGSTLRSFNLANAPKIQARLAELGSKKGWSEAQRDEKTRNFLDDAKLAQLDDTSNELLIKIDTLGRPADGAAPDCSKLDELKAAGVELLAVMKAKSQHTLAKIDAELAKGADAPAVAALTKPAAEPAPPKSIPAEKPPQSKPAAAIKTEKTDARASAKAPEKKLAATDPPPPAIARNKPSAASSWSTTSELDPSADRQALPRADTPGEVETAAYDPGVPYAEGDEEGYTIDEIQEATRGFFGSISTGLASVIEHAFRKSGRPTAYVLGSEGGGAFLAGLRYGSGTIYPRRGSPSKVYWHGPSVGFDFGAEGSRTLFLIYSLPDRESLFRRFTGIDGSAYFVGGVGITFLKGGDVLMAPIRSGVGLRLGAGIGYIRFTPEASWNPF